MKLLILGLILGLCISIYAHCEESVDIYDIPGKPGTNLVVVTHGGQEYKLEVKHDELEKKVTPWIDSILRGSHENR